MAAIDHRESVRRQHRQLALFLAIQCWMRGLDGVTLSREAVIRLLGLEKWEPERIPHLKDDLKECFPFQRETNKIGEPYYLELSRIDFYGGSPKMGSIGCQSRLPFADLEESWSKAAPFLGSRGAFCEQFISLYLAIVSQGNASPSWCGVIESAEEEN